MSHKLCLSLMPRDMEALQDSLQRRGDIGIVEIRLDHFPDMDLAAVVETLDVPVIATLRSTSEGGFWEGDDDAYAAHLQAAAAAGANYIDLEWERAAAVQPKLSLSPKTELIVSRHTAERDYAVLEAMLDRMLEVGADVTKLVFQAEDLPDNLTALRLIEHGRSGGRRVVIHAMGEEGQLSRILGALRGNEWTYVAPVATEKTAAGQLTHLSATHHFFLHKKSRDSAVLGLVGHPIQQSKGWRLHNRLVDGYLPAKPRSSRFPSDFIYCNFSTADFESFWNEWSDHLHGLSVTIPYKEQAVACADVLAPEVQISGVCNTLVRSGDGWKAHNTDLTAIETILKPRRDHLRRGAIIIGTGATARSAIAALKRLEISPIFVVGRNEERGLELMELFGIDYLREDEVHYAGAALIIQCTPVGMAPHTDQMPVGANMFRKKRLVLDVIYNPADTLFLRSARERGCETISGVDMFILQAARQFELFTGATLTPDEVRRVWDEIV